MKQESAKKKGFKEGSWLSGVVILAFFLVGLIWAASYFGAEARVRRATAQVVALAEKTGEESPMSLGLSANRFGTFLSPQAVLELNEYGALATGRQEIVQLFAQIRSMVESMTFSHPTIAVLKTPDGMVTARVEARYRFVVQAESVSEGDGSAELVWSKGEDGWQISRAVLSMAEGATLPTGWK